ncbi:toxin-antitoxin system HicB family antitoxin [Nocardioides sp. MAH-18]|uniref:Toxin-antitoxin system HicB family antitoxin n=1 Tax=Nocardioides agri TaxID=2682843 RepID=A0A6L6XR54_9ACTN|nr:MULTISPECIES: toxin-antitoxin system HicB family antitoxin [unclassified Nocardioides]MBA2954775.1 toxin-antitoxin system HicB family antitoxin [Nocardioides sp. CGMCC 1.13656]MVQ49630.1 toxin-antitoxin system HicB family antitoxin [Nocardioides sp. MAH-18]
MDITPYVESLRRDLLAAAEAAGPDAREATERLTYALDPAARLALMEAISQAAAEITAELPAGGVDVRLNGRDLEFAVHAPPAPAASAPAPAPADEPEDDGNLARITLRIPESVKTRAEELAAKSGSSLNTWLVNVVRAATRDGAINVDIDLSSIPFLTGGSDPFGGKRGGKRMSGWV